MSYGCRNLNTNTTATTASCSSPSSRSSLDHRPVQSAPVSLSYHLSNHRCRRIFFGSPVTASSSWFIIQSSSMSTLRRRKINFLFLREDEEEVDRRCCCSAAAAAEGTGEEDEDTRRIDGEKIGDEDQQKKKVKVLVAATATVLLGVGNRVLNKLALVPLKQYPFFLAQLATFGYVLVYFSILYFRYRAGIVTHEMLSLPRGPYIIVGLLEALAAASGMAAGAILSGASIPILSQTFLIWQLLLSAVLLRRRYKINQIVGCLLVATGVIITVASGSGSGLSLTDASLFWTLMMVTSFFLQAADTVVKEIIFVGAAKQLQGGSVDLFVVNSYGSAFQAIFICLLLPFLSKLWGVPFVQLPSYLKDGAACFLNIGSMSKGCEGAPLLPLLFILVNMAFNVSLLHLLKISSAVVSCLASTFSVPLSVYAFTLPLPYIGVASSLPTGFVMGVVVLVAGLLVYSWTPSAGLGGKPITPVDH